MTRNIERTRLYLYVLFIMLYLLGGDLQAQNIRSGNKSFNSPNLSFIIGNKKIAVASNGDILSVSEIGYQSYSNRNDIIVVDYNDVAVEANRDASVWKGDHYPSVFYFPIDKYLLISEYRNNNIMLSALDELVRNKQVTNNLEAIEIIGACSPVGSEEYNLKLALSRCMALRSYLRWKHLQFAESFPIKFNIIGVDKLGYSILKNQRWTLPEKEIWNMLQYAAIRLKMKDGSYIIPGFDKPKTFFASPAPQEDKPVVVPRTEIRQVVSQPCDTIVIQKTEIIREFQQIPAEFPAKFPAETKKPVYFALKNNLLYDVALLPNLTAEWYMGKQWSLAVEGNWSWWTYDQPIQNRWYHRIQTAGVELRKWVNSPYPLNGHALGGYAMIGNYDLRLFPTDENSKGWLSYQSWSAGLSYAYSFPIANRLNLEMGLAVGYMGGRYYQYDYCMIHEHWAKRATFNRNYIGPTRASLSLVWLLGAGNDKKSKDNYLSTKK
jgi:outer membrane protein OmpA-like peptidoglycan-associated protein